jgi:hypothetical protein
MDFPALHLLTGVRNPPGCLFRPPFPMI